MTVSNSIAMKDYMTPTLRYIIHTMNMMISNMQRLDAQSNKIGNDAFSAMRRNIASAEVELDTMEQNLTSMYHSSNMVGQSFSSWAMKLTGVWSALQLAHQVIAAIGKLTKITDEYISTNARLGLINDGLQTQEQLQQRIMKSANQTRSSYAETANLVTKIGMTGAVRTNDEAIKFAEKVNMLLKIGGGTETENSASLQQLAQALGSGRLQGDEFKSLRENAPALMATLAKGLDVPIGQLREMAAAGELTSDIIIKAFDRMDSEIRNQFVQLPRTFSENAVVMKNIMTEWLGKFMETGGALWRINERFTQFVNWLNTEQGQNILDIIATTLNFIVFLIDLVIGAFVGLWDMVSEAGPVWESLLTGIIVAGFVAILPLIWGAVTAIGAFIASAAVAVAPFLPLIIVVSLVTYEARRMGVTFQDVFNFVGGLAGLLVAFLVNRFIYFYNTVGEIAVFLQNLFIDPVFAIQNLFYNMIQNVLEYFEAMINGILSGLNFLISKTNSAFGTNLKTFDHVSFANKNPMKKPSSDKAVKTWNKVGYADHSAFAQKGAELATGLLDKGEKILRGGGMSSIGVGSIGAGSIGAGKNIGDVGKVGKVGKIEDKVNIADEDIKMLADIVTRDRVNQINLSVQTKSPVIQNSATIREEADLDKLANKLAEKLDEASETSTDIYYDEEAV